MDPDEKLNLKQQRAVQLFYAGIANGDDYQKIADDIGVSPKTLRRWRKKKAFRRKLQQLFRSESTELLSLAAANMKTTLMKALENDEPSREANKVISMLLKATGMTYRTKDDSELVPALQVTKRPEEGEEEDEEAPKAVEVSPDEDDE